MNETRSRLNRTFGRRIGKSISSLKQGILDNELPKHQFTPEIFSGEKRRIFLEIGFGMGEHFLEQIKLNPHDLFIGVEVYLNGVASLLQKAKEQGSSNFLIWPDDLDMMLNSVPDHSLDGIYVLFPDPWHKRRYLKKRLFNAERLHIFKDKLKSGGFVAFASDIDDYFASSKALLENDPDFTIPNQDSSAPHTGYVETKYHQKAIKEGRNPQFILGQYLLQKKN